MSEHFWAIGIILLPLLGTKWKSWFTVYVATSIPTIVIMLVFHWIPDSPKWLIKHGHLQEAKKVLLHAAEINRKQVNEVELEEKLKELIEGCKNDPPDPTWITLWQGPPGTKRKLFAAHFSRSIFFSLHICLLLNVRVMGKYYLKTNTVLTGLSEIIGIFIGFYLIIKTSKKWVWMSVMNILTSLLAASMIFVPDTSE